MAYWLVKIVLTPVLRAVFRVSAEGTGHVPRRGPAILASNHRSFVDSVFLPLVVRRKVTFVAKAEYFESRKTAWFFRAVGMIPLKREGGSASARALAAAREVLEGGGVLGIYPEGTRSRDGRLYRGHTGVARLAIQCGVPVVPVAQFGTSEVQPVGAMRPKLFRRVGVRIGEPLHPPATPPEGDGLTPDGHLREFTDQVMAAIQELSGQEMAGCYAKRDVGPLSAPGSEAEPVPPAPAGA